MKRIVRVSWSVFVIIGCLTATTGILRDVLQLEHGFLRIIYPTLVILAALIAFLDVLRDLTLEYFQWQEHRERVRG